MDAGTEYAIALHPRPSIVIRFPTGSRRGRQLSRWSVAAEPWPQADSHEDAGVAGWMPGPFCGPSETGTARLACGCLSQGRRVILLVTVSPTGEHEAVCLQDGRPPRRFELPSTSAI